MLVGVLFLFFFLIHSVSSHGLRLKRAFVCIILILLLYFCTILSILPQSCFFLPAYSSIFPVPIFLSELCN